MNSAIIAAIVFACLFGAGLLGVRVRAILPENHLNPDTKDAVKGWDGISRDDGSPGPRTAGRFNKGCI